MATAVILAGILLAVVPASTSEETYLQDLTAEFETSTIYLDEAAAAISLCNDRLLACLQTPEPTARRLDNASLGLEGVLTNLTALDVPATYAASHALLETGFQQIIDGLRLYATGLRERDVDTMSSGADLVREGRGNISTANNAIFGRSVAGIDFLLILSIAVVATAAALGVLVFYVARDVRQNRQGRIRDSGATCPKCGQVLDKWWTYRGWQIRQWRSDHLKTHEAEAGSSRGPKGGGPPSP